MKIGDKPYLSYENFEKFFRDLEALGFEEKNPDQMMREIKESGSVPFLKKKFQGREKVYELKRGIKTHFVCTSFVPSINDINKEDYVWPAQKTKGNPTTFFWFPLLRTENFMENALKDVKMLIEVSEKMPKCPECGEELFLVHYPEVMHLMRYVCGNTKFIHRHQNNAPYAIFDNPNLSEETSMRLFNRYQQFYEDEYKRQLANPDVVHQSARVLRAGRKKEAQCLHDQKFNQFGDIKKFPDGTYDDGPHNDGQYEK